MVNNTSASRTPRRLRPKMPFSCPIHRRKLPKIYEIDDISDDESSGNAKYAKTRGHYMSEGGSPELEAKSDPIKKKYNRPLPRLPFCEEYDGINMRKTSTISQSIVELIASQKEKRKGEHSDTDGEDEVDFKSTGYFDRLKDLHDLFDTINSESSDYDSVAQSPDTIFDSDSYGDVDPFENVRLSPDEGDDICSIDLEFRHISKSNQLMLNVVKAEDVSDKKSPDKLIDTFVKVCMFHGKKNKKQHTNVVGRSRDPVFNHTFFMDNVSEKWMHLMCVRVQLYQKKMFRSRCIGETLIWLDDLDLMPETHICLTESLKKPFL